MSTYGFILAHLVFSNLIYKEKWMSSAITLPYGDITLSFVFTSLEFIIICKHNNNFTKGVILLINV